MGGPTPNVYSKTPLRDRFPVRLTGTGGVLDDGGSGRFGDMRQGTDGMGRVFWDARATRSARFAKRH